MKKIYIVLTYTGTILSRMVKIGTRAEYAHSSIALNEELNEMYSFGRLHPYVAFWGGFVKEGINEGTFKRFKNTTVGVYSIDVTDEQYENLKNVIDNIRNNKKDYKFNIRGMALVSLNMGNSRINRFYCAEFVKYVLEKSGIDISELPKVIRPEDFKKLKNTKLIYKGYLKDYIS